jgi:hypothetical protein
MRDLATWISIYMPGARIILANSAWQKSLPGGLANSWLSHLTSLAKQPLEFIVTVVTALWVRCTGGLGRTSLTAVRTSAVHVLLATEASMRATNGSNCSSYYSYARSAHKAFKPMMGKKVLIAHFQARAAHCGPSRLSPWCGTQRLKLVANWL